eukprot:CAMPEP_0170519232 /NCGR_PEP_ID=MMETSP0209-20121228/4727_1 /TAXON_ID=665100 ORGANISM="Litonotus pictus, Strain P1" /NCGR_SAMPLE_ID=MMETSP0209 /ASSEMBLY_ACC=CAM_ASM_000301 /LENGTH=368 /DNA_ID=CAMNT_0010805071 /DNA_START=6 /DNA_END=1112 /DNA_ORIENTATION=+
MNLNKIFLLQSLAITIILVSVPFTKAGEIATDITAFENDLHITPTYEVLCFYGLKVETNPNAPPAERTYITFGSSRFTDKAEAVSLYKAITPDHATLNRDNLAHDAATLTDTDLEYVPAHAFCILRNTLDSEDSLTVPDRSYLITRNFYHFAYFPSMIGYHPRAGGAMYTHVREIMLTHTGSTSPSGMNIFKAQYSTTYSTFKTEFDAFTDTINRAVWGPYYKYDPLPQSDFNFYYPWPRVIVSDEPAHKASDIVITVTDTNENDLLDHPNSTYSFTDILDTTKIPGIMKELSNEGTLRDCEFHSGSVYILLGTNFCIYNDGANTLTCTPDESKRTPDAGLTNNLTLDFTVLPLCLGKNTLYLKAEKN